MTITSGKRSSVQNPQRYISANAGNPGLMAAPTATDGGTGSTVSCAFTTVTGNTSYQVLSNPGSLTATGAASPIVVSGLTAGTAYTFQIAGINANSTGAYSAASNSVTPAVPTSFESIATATGTGSSATITFSSIPSTYTSLQIRATMKSNSSSSIDYRTFQFNGDTGANYAFHQLYGDGSTVGATGSASQNRIGSGVSGGLLVPGSDASVINMTGTVIIDIHDYASNSKYKTVRFVTGSDRNGSGRIILFSGLWMSTNPITSIQFSAGSDSWTTASTFSLYGIKGA